jgi:hypothetical protein
MDQHKYEHSHIVKDVESVCDPIEINEYPNSCTEKFCKVIIWTRNFVIYCAAVYVIIMLYYTF